jgi:hypothetical protein|tara:strand:- start:21 stop:326 length:306 start_codon:yes stop_codon:yes gene_type:complete
VPRNKLSKDVIAHWPEVFKDIEVRTVPLEYLHSITVRFRDGKAWVIELDEKAPKKPDLEYGLESLFREYDDAIDTIDFRLNTHKVRKDIEGRTKSFMKKRK